MSEVGVRKTGCCPCRSCTLNCLPVKFFFSSRRRHTRCGRDWSSDVCSSDLNFRPACFDKPIAVTADNDQNASSTSAFGRLEYKPFQVMKLLFNAVDAVLFPHNKEIGRASCRERVWMWWGAGAVLTESGEGMW